MGKRIITQRRGKGSNRYQANTHRGKGNIEHPQGEKEGEVVDIEHDPARTAPVAEVQFADSTESDDSARSSDDKEYILAPEGLAEGDTVTISREAPLEKGNTLPLREIPEGVPVFNIELQPGDGGKISRSAGTYAFIVTHEADKTLVQLPSQEIKEFNPDCRATIGQVAGAGKRDKEFRKAGDKHHREKARGKLYPKTSAVAMNATDHPFGGSAKPGKPKTVSRHAPAGKKVGSNAASRTGKKEE
ncbi:MAG: 50S ribosomal protein L2 [Candidatus Nanohaloarchaea archaeon]|nr:50S ribosomal protein L2 [Candidatus Nanohaloarchaea archaeon]